MRISPLTTLPFVVLLLVVGWSAWPYIEPAHAAASSKPQVPEVPMEKLVRMPDVAPSRDPFELPSDPLPKPVPFSLSKSSVAASKAKAPGAPPNSNASQSAKGRREAPPEGLRHRLARMFEEAKRRLVTLQKQAELARRLDADLRAKLPSQIALTATSILGSQRLAILNGRAYKVGESIEGLTGTGPVMLAAVGTSSVLVRCGPSTIEVGFSNASAPAGPARAVASTPKAAPKRNSKLSPVRRSTRSR